MNYNIVTFCMRTSDDPENEPCTNQTFDMSVEHLENPELIPICETCSLPVCWVQESQQNNSMLSNPIYLGLETE